MRDIRKDLKERLAGMAGERCALDNREQFLRLLLAQEEERWSGEPSLFSHLVKPEQPGEETSPIRAFLVEAMADGQTWSLQRLKEHAIAKGVQFEGKSPGQSLHGALVAMKRSRLVNQVGKGKWRLKNVDAPVNNSGETR